MEDFFFPFQNWATGPPLVVPPSQRRPRLSQFSSGSCRSYHLMVNIALYLLMQQHNFFTKNIQNPNFALVLAPLLTNIISSKIRLCYFSQLQGPNKILKTKGYLDEPIFAFWKTLLALLSLRKWSYSIFLENRQVPLAIASLHATKLTNYQPAGILYQSSNLEGPVHH